jgi:hypothetical protein
MWIEFELNAASGGDNTVTDSFRNRLRPRTHGEWQAPSSPAWAFLAAAGTART